MKIFSKLTAFTLQQVLGDGVKHTADWLDQYCRDPSQALPKAVRVAEQQSWQVLELALQRNTLSGKLKAKFSSGTLHAMLVPLQDLLDRQGRDFVAQCLQELQQAQRDPAFMSDETWHHLDFAVLDDPEQLVMAAEQVLRDSAAELPAYPALAQLLTVPTAGGPLLLVMFSFFLRQAILSDATLTDELNFKRLRNLWQQQEAGFVELQGIMGDMAQEVSALRQQIQEMLGFLQAGRGAVSPDLSFSLHSESERQLVKKLLQQFRALPVAQRALVPDLLDGLGRLELAVGDFQQAETLFSEFTAHTSDDIEKATSLYNQHRAALERADLTVALEYLLQAAQLAPAEFAPFPLHRYQVQRILGAGGFGTVFLCTDSYSQNAQVVIKTLLQEVLARDIGEIFHEAHLLKQLQHPQIIQVLHWDFVEGVTRSRPYLVLEYFAGMSLQAYVAKHGTLSPAEALSLGQLLATTLRAAHQSGILHRDLKPANVLVRKTGAGWDLKLIDFGLGVRQQTGRGQSLLGRSLSGTFNYAPPEQLGEGGTVGPYSDVYSFGRTLCYALFLSPNPTPKQWRSLGVPLLEEALSDCLEQLPDERLPDFVTVQRVFRKALQQPEQENEAEKNTESSPQDENKQRNLSEFKELFDEVFQEEMEREATQQCEKRQRKRPQPEEEDYDAILREMELSELEEVRKCDEKIEATQQHKKKQRKRQKAEEEKDEFLREMDLLILQAEEEEDKVLREMERLELQAKDDDKF